jgi:hypothetical protein
MKPKRCPELWPFTGYQTLRDDASRRCTLELGHSGLHTIVQPSGMDYAPDEEPAAPRKRRWLCDECGRETSRILVNVTVTLDDGTREGSMIAVCASCLGVRSTLERLCDADGCPNLPSSGTPTKDGYVFACHEHAPTGEEGK